MIVKAPVFGRQKCGDDAFRDGADGNENSPLAGKLRNQRAVMRMNARHDGWLVFGETLVIRQIFRLLRNINADSGRSRHEDKHERAKTEPKKTQEQAFAALALLLGRGRWR